MGYKTIVPKTKLHVVNSNFPLDQHNSIKHLRTIQKQTAKQSESSYYKLMTHHTKIRQRTALIADQNAYSSQKRCRSTRRSVALPYYTRQRNGEIETNKMLVVVKRFSCSNPALPH